MLALLQKDIRALLLKLYPEQESIIDTLQLHHIDQKFGDLALNIGFILAKTTNQNLDDINQSIKNELLQLPYVEKIELVNGFINVILNVSFYRMLCETIFSNGYEYGKKEMKQIVTPTGTRNYIVNFDFASMNPTGPMHAGHLGSAILADTLCNILESQGYEVQREYYMNDTGGQIEKLVQAIYIRYCELHNIKLDIEQEYVGEYLIHIAAKIQTEYGSQWLNKSFAEYYEVFRSMSVELLMNDIKEDLADLGIKHTSYFSEYQMQHSPMIQEVYELLKQQKLVKQQKLNKPANWKGEYEGMMIEGLELDSQFRPLFKRDGSHTYLMGDIAYHINRSNRCDWIIDCFGADHFEHANMLKELMSTLTTSTSALATNTSTLSAESSQLESTPDHSQPLATNYKKPICNFDVKLCQMVKFSKDGQMLTFSKRTGTYVTARDIINALGKDALRISMLTRKANAHLTLNLNQLLQTDDNNPVFYIQYAYARCCSALNKGDTTSDTLEYTINTHSLPDEFLSEFLIKKLLNKFLFWPQMLEQCVYALEPHGLLIYMQEIAKVFHSIWYHGGINPLLQLTKPHNGEYPGMILCKLFKYVFGSGLRLLNIEEKAQMTNRT